MILLVGHDFWLCNIFYFFLRSQKHMWLNFHRIQQNAKVPIFHFKWSRRWKNGFHFGNNLEFATISIIFDERKSVIRVFFRLLLQKSKMNQLKVRTWLASQGDHNFQINNFYPPEDSLNNISEMKIDSLCECMFKYETQYGNQQFSCIRIVLNKR